MVSKSSNICLDIFTDRTLFSCDNVISKISLTRNLLFVQPLRNWIVQQIDLILHVLHSYQGRLILSQIKAAKLLFVLCFLNEPLKWASSLVYLKKFIPLEFYVFNFRCLKVWS